MKLPHDMIPPGGGAQWQTLQPLSRMNDLLQVESRTAFAAISMGIIVKALPVEQVIADTRPEPICWMEPVITYVLVTTIIIIMIIQFNRYNN